MHFDPFQINEDGRVKGDPKYFPWNDWGNLDDRESAITTIGKLQEARDEIERSRRFYYPDFLSEVEIASQPKDTELDQQQVGGKSYYLLFFFKPLPSVKDQLQVNTRVSAAIACYAGFLDYFFFSDMYPLQYTPQPTDHLYLHAPQSILADKGTQTDVSSFVDVCEQFVQTAEPIAQAEVQPQSPQQHFDIIECVTQSDARANDYTGITKVSLLHGKNMEYIYI